MNVEELLAQSSHRLASGLTPPPAPDAGRLGAVAVAQRRRRRVGAAAAATVAAVVAVAALVPVLGGRDTDAGPVDGPPHSRLGNVPAWMDRQGDVHVGEHELDLTVLGDTGPGFDFFAPRFALTERGVVWRVGQEGPLYWRPLAGEPVELTDQSPRYYTADPLGALVVWVTAAHEMVAYDVAERSVVDSRPLPAKLTDYDGLPPVLFVGGDQVVYEQGEDVWTWDLTTKTASRMPGVAASDVLDYGRAVSVVATNDLRDRGVSGAVQSLAQIEFRTEAGTVQAVPGRLFKEGRLSPDGRWFITSTGYEAGLRPVMLDTSTGQQVPLDLPNRMRGAYADPWGWAGTDVLIIALIAPGGEGEEVWTCQPTVGLCELLPRAPFKAYPG